MATSLPDLQHDLSASMPDKRPEKQPEKQQERRQSLEDRRGRTRQGKLDRRRNRCGGCRFYGNLSEPKTTKIEDKKEICQQHQTLVAAKDFACVLFEGI